MTQPNPPPSPDDRLRSPLHPGAAIAHWQVGDTLEARYDVPDQPMAGEMDPFFFLTRHKNFIPHEYPCRTRFAGEYRGRRPEVRGAFAARRWWLPFGSPRLDLSGFWYRPTRIANWARTEIECDAGGEARLRLATCGGAVLWVNGSEAGWLAGYARNLDEAAEFTVTLRPGCNEILVFFDDLAERDTRFFIALDYLAGPAARVALPVPVAGTIAAALESALAGARFDRTTYLGDDVVIVLPAPLPVAVVAQVSIAGEALPGDRAQFEQRLEPGETRLALGSSAAMPAGFRLFTIRLRTGAFEANRVQGVEICPAGDGIGPATLPARVTEALEHVATRAERDIVSALARLATGRGGAQTNEAIAAGLGAIEDCHDCADFALVPLLWARGRFAEAMDPGLRDRIDRAILGYRYWMDEPGNDVQWYFSENHALLFHTAAYLAGHLMPAGRFVRSGRSGREQSRIGAERVRAWLDHFERWEMAEFNSAPYFPIDVKGLAALFALAPDADISGRAGAAVGRLLSIVARSSHHGLLTAAQGRSYEETLRAGRTLELSAIARLAWGRGWLGRHFHALPLLALALRDHGLALPADLSASAGVDAGAGREWRFSQGQDRFAALYHYKTAAYAMGSVARYRWGEWGYQETLLHLRLGSRPEAAIWINHPGETIQFGTGRPSFWGGCGTIARVQQYRALAVLEFDAGPEQPDFTHAWFPRAMFDETRVTGDLALARCGAGLVLLRGNRAFTEVDDGPTAGAELRLEGRRGRWIVRLDDDPQAGGLAGMAARYGGLAAREVDGALVVEDPGYGRVIFAADGHVEAEGRRLEPRDWTIAGTAHDFPQAEARAPARVATG